MVARQRGRRDRGGKSRRRARDPRRSWRAEHAGEKSSLRHVRSRPDRKNSHYFGNRRRGTCQEVSPKPVNARHEGGRVAALRRAASSYCLVGPFRKGARNRRSRARSPITLGGAERTWNDLRHWGGATRRPAALPLVTSS